MLIQRHIKTSLGTAWYFVIVVLFMGCNAGTLPFYFENKIQDEVPVDVLRPTELAIQGIPKRLGLLYLPENYRKFNILYVNSADEPDDTLTHLHGNDMLNGLYDGIFEQINSNTPFEIIETMDTLDFNDSLTTDIGNLLSEKWQVDGILVPNRLRAEFKYVLLDERPAEGFSEQVLLAGLAVELNMYNYAKNNIVSWSDTLGDHFYSTTVLDLVGYSYVRTPISEVDGYLGFTLGKQVVNKVFTHWETVNRKFYGRAHPSLRAAKRLVMTGDWEEAGKIWKENKDDENRVLAKHSRYNLILYEEVMNNFDKALELARGYEKKHPNEHIKEYIEVLEQRSDEKKILDKQLKQMATW